MTILTTATTAEVVDHIYNSTESYTDDEGNYWSVYPEGDKFFFHIEAEDGSRQRIFKFVCEEVWNE